MNWLLLCHHEVVKSCRYHVWHIFDMMYVFWCEICCYHCRSIPFLRERYAILILGWLYKGIDGVLLPSNFNLAQFQANSHENAKHSSHTYQRMTDTTREKIKYQLLSDQKTNSDVDVIDLLKKQMWLLPIWHKLKAIHNLAYEVKDSKHELGDLFEAIREDRGRFVIDSFDNIRFIMASSFQLEMTRKKSVRLKANIKASVLHSESGNNITLVTRYKRQQPRCVRHIIGCTCR